MLEIKGVRFNVEINRKRIRNMYLRLKDNTVVVSAPFLMPEFEIYRFIETRREWIYKAYNYQIYKNKVSRLYNGGNTFYIFGEPYELVCSIGKKTVSIKDKVIYLTYKDESLDRIKYLYKYLDKYLLIKAQEYLNKYLFFLKDYGYYKVPELHCKIMKTRWGVCYTGKNRINISSYLIHYPFKCLQYIMVHEMTHFIIPNHSRRFYSIVASNMPDYKSAVEELKL